MLTNLRPRQIATPPWPWTNRVMGGYPTVAEREPWSWMPDLVACYDWEHIEGQPAELPFEGTCSRDMKSIFTTAVRMYGFERLYTQLLSNNNVFAMIGAEFWRWNQRLLAETQIDYLMIGDDLAHNGGLFMPPEMLEPLIDRKSVV